MRRDLIRRFSRGDVLGDEQLELDQAAQRGIDVRHLLGDELELVRGQVLGEHAAVAIEDQAAIGRDRHDAHAIALRKIGVIVVPHDLQLHELAEQGEHQGQHDHAGRERAPQEHALLGPVILDADGADQLKYLINLSTGLRLFTT